MFIKLKKNILRGLHLQTKNSQDKYVTVLKGKIFDVSVDLRKNSKTFGKHFSIYLTNKPYNSIYIPKGFAHGFITLRDNTIVQYLVDNDYSPENEGSIVWTHFQLIKLKIENLVGKFDENDIVMSDKDLITKNFKL